MGGKTLVFHTDEGWTQGGGAVESRGLHWVRVAVVGSQRLGWSGEAESSFSL